MVEAHEHSILSSDSDASSSLSLNLVVEPEPNSVKIKAMKFLSYGVFCTQIVLSFYLIAISFTQVSLFSFHPVCMTLGFLVLMPQAIAAFDTENGKTQFKDRVKRHQIMQILGGAVTFIGFGVIYVNKTIHDKPHFQSWHGLLGLITVMCLFSVGCGGFLAKYSFDLRAYVKPVHTKLIHSLFGALTLILGYTVVILGLYSGWYQKNGVQDLIYIFVAILMVNMICTLQKATKTFRERFVTAFMRSSL